MNSEAHSWYMAKTEFKLKFTWFQGQSPIRKGSFSVVWLSGKAGPACFHGYRERKGLPWLGFRPPKSPLSMTWWNFHPARCCQLQCPGFLSSHLCISAELILFCFVWKLLAHVAFLSTWRGHQREDFTYLILPSLQGRACSCAHSRCPIDIQSEMVAEHGRGEPGLRSLSSPVRSAMA